MFYMPFANPCIHLHCIIADITYRPQITNLPIDHPILVSEGTTLGTVIYKLSYIDLDTTETHTIYAELDPGWAWNYFTLNPTSMLYYTGVDLYFMLIVFKNFLECNLCVPTAAEEVHSSKQEALNGLRGPRESICGCSLGM